MEDKLPTLTNSAGFLNMSKLLGMECKATLHKAPCWPQRCMLWTVLSYSTTEKCKPSEQLIEVADYTLCR